jgi:hypothetical protein
MPKDKILILLTSSEKKSRSGGNTEWLGSWWDESNIEAIDSYCFCIIQVDIETQVEDHVYDLDKSSLIISSIIKIDKSSNYYLSNDIDKCLNTIVSNPNSTNLLILNSKYINSKYIDVIKILSQIDKTLNTNLYDIYYAAHTSDDNKDVKNKYGSNMFENFWINMINLKFQINREANSDRNCSFNYVWNVIVNQFESKSLHNLLPAENQENDTEGINIKSTDTKLNILEQQENDYLLNELHRIKHNISDYLLPLDIDLQGIEERMELEDKKDYIRKIFNEYKESKKETIKYIENIRVLLLGNAKTHDAITERCLTELFPEYRFDDLINICGIEMENGQPKYVPSFLSEYFEEIDKAVKNNSEDSFIEIFLKQDSANKYKACFRNINMILDALRDSLI